jgi:hypothetical protein
MKNKNKALFIKTKDFETSETLKNEGFELVDYTDGTWTFVNNAERPLTFDNNKVAYSNMLCI